MKLRLLDRVRCLLTGQTLESLDHKRALEETNLRRAAAKAEHERQMELEQYRRERAEKQREIEREAEAKNTREVFARTKSATTVVDQVSLAEYKKTIEQHIATFNDTGQIPAKAKAEWLLAIVDKEQELLQKGFNKYVSRAKVARFVKEHKTRAIQIVSASDYMRVIPEEAKKAMEHTKGIFDDYVIVYTDHSIKAKASAVRKQPDPILFGIFSAQITQDGQVHELNKKLDPMTNSIPVVSDRMYFLADWEDDKCDLTFDQMLEESEDMHIGMTAGDLSALESASIRIGSFTAMR